MSQSVISDWDTSVKSGPFVLFLKRIMPTFALSKANNMKTSLRISILAFTLSTLGTSHLKAQEKFQAFAIQVTNMLSDDDKTKSRPHRSPSASDDVSGVFCSETGTLCLSVPYNLDITSVRIYKDGALLMEDNYPVADDDGSLYYGLAFYGSGSYRVEILSDNGISYVGYFTI